ncbi:hypothetical protein WG66_013412 [Moniliophthora roreri]|nr:hypothetical protein WG66_013412 [Moniliophthora roreri]
MTLPPVEAVYYLLPPLLPRQLPHVATTFGTIDTIRRSSLRSLSSRAAILSWARRHFKRNKRDIPRSGAIYDAQGQVSCALSIHTRIRMLFASRWYRLPGPT